MSWKPRISLAHRTEFLLALGALLLYLPGISWGLPNATSPLLTQPWGHDDIAPLGPLTEIHNTFIEAKADRFLAYPLTHHWVVAAAYSPYLLYLMASGDLQKPVPTFPYGLQDPAHTLRVLSLIARSVTVLLAAGTVVAAYLAVRSLWNRTCGVLAGVFVMLLYPMFYYSRTANLDVPALFWAAGGLVAYARILRAGYTVRRGIWLGVFAAMSAGTKDQGAGLFLLMPLVLLPLHFQRVSQTDTQNRPSRLWLPPAATLLAGLFVYSISSGFVFRPERHLAHVAWITGLRPDSAVYYGHPASLEGYVGLLREIGRLVVDSTGGPMLALALVGICMAALRDRLALAFLVPALSLLLAVIFPVRYVEVRFLLPVAFTVACFAAWPLGAGLRSQRASIRGASAFLTLAICVLPVLRGMDLTHAMRRDSRYAAADWLNARAHPGSQIEFFGPYQKLPRLRPDVQLTRAVRFIGATRDVRYTQADIRAMAHGIAERAPDFVLVIPDHSSLPAFPYGITCPVELYDLLRDGSLGYQLAARFETPPLFPWAGRPILLKYPVVNPPVEIFAPVSRLRRVEEGLD